MIKLIASDLDGTLLQNGAQAPSAEMLDMIRSMKNLGIQFVAASGRQYPNMKRMFGPVWQDIIFIAENGGAIVYRDQVLDKTVIERELARELIRDLYRLPQCDVVASGIMSSYIQPKPKSRPYVDFILYEAKNTVTIVNDLTDLEEEIVKVSALAYDGQSMALAPALTERWAPHFQVAVSGKEWVDFTIANKGIALKKVQNRLSIRREEMVAFGDNFNDESLFRAVGYSYAMHSAVEEIHQMARHRCETVETVVRNILEYQSSQQNSPCPV